MPTQTQIQVNLYAAYSRETSPLQLGLMRYSYTLPNKKLTTKKRYLAKLRLNVLFDIDSEFRRFYQLCVDTAFKSIMRDNLTIAINY